MLDGAGWFWDENPASVASESGFDGASLRERRRRIALGDSPQDFGRFSPNSIPPWAPCFARWATHGFATLDGAGWFWGENPASVASERGFDGASLRERRRRIALGDSPQDFGRSARTQSLPGHHASPAGLRTALPCWMGVSPLRLYFLFASCLNPPFSNSSARISKLFVGILSPPCCCSVQFIFLT